MKKMELEEKRYQICRITEAEETLYWGLLPEELIDLINPINLVNVITYTPHDGLHESTVVGFKKVDKFSSGMKEYRLEGENIILGV